MSEIEADQDWATLGGMLRQDPFEELDYQKASLWYQAAAKVNKPKKYHNVAGTSDRKNSTRGFTWMAHEGNIEHCRYLEESHAINEEEK